MGDANPNLEPETAIVKGDMLRSLWVVPLKHQGGLDSRHPIRLYSRPEDCFGPVIEVI